MSKKISKAPYVPTTKRIDESRVRSGETIKAHAGTRLVGFCTGCRRFVEVGSDITCGNGHSRDDIISLFELPCDLPVWHLPTVNIGAACLPPVWGTAHGMFWPVVYYPLWFLCDYLVYSSIIGALPVFAGIAAAAATIAAHIGFGVWASPKGYAHAASVYLPDHYLEAERKWARGMAGLLVVVLAFIVFYHMTYSGR